MPKKSSSKKVGKASDMKPERRRSKIGTPEKSSLKKVKQASDMKQEEPSSKVPKNEIDEIFSGRKRKKPELQKLEISAENGGEKLKLMKKKKKTVKDTEGRFTDPPANARKKTEDGLNIYSEEELGINTAGVGDTPLCPFDCACCF